MGKVFSAVFGGKGSKAKSQQQAQSTNSSQSESHNDAFPVLEKAYSPQIEQGNQATDYVASLLGLHGNPAADDAFSKYRDSTGYNFLMDSGQKAIDSSAASKGSLMSGQTLKALSDYGQNTGASFLSSYLDKLMGVSGQGLQAGGLLASSGQKSSGMSTGQSTSSGTSNSSSYDKPGISSFLGQIAKTAAAGGAG